MARAFSVPTRDEVEQNKNEIRASWDNDERCLRRLVAILKQQQLAAQLALLERDLVTSRAG